MGDKIAFVECDGERYPITLRPKTFKTGSQGYYAWGKITVDGIPHQLSGNIVRIGSKPK
jgi:hypothetical protein